MVAQEFGDSAKLIKYRKEIWKKVSQGYFKGNYLETKTWSTLELVLIERPNMKAVTIIGTMVAKELPISWKLIRYRKTIWKNVLHSYFKGKYIETENLRSLRTLLIERPNVQAVTIICTMVAEELRVSGTLIKYRKKRKKCSPLLLQGKISQN